MPARRILRIISGALLTLTIACGLEHGHDHGALRLRLIPEGKAALFEFSGHAEGFTDSERETARKLEKKLPVLISPAGGPCTWKGKDAVFHSEGGHRTFRFVFQLNCADALAGRRIRLQLDQFFTDLERLEVSVESKTGVRTQVLEKGRGVLVLGGEES